MYYRVINHGCLHREADVRALRFSVCAIPLSALLSGAAALTDAFAKDPGYVPRSAAMPSLTAGRR